MKICPKARPAPPVQLRVLFEDESILVLDKPGGLLTSTVPREPRPTLWAMAKDYMALREPDARVGLVHRLDKEASGILIFSKNDAAYQSLKSQFFNHAVGREYTVMVHGLPNPPTGKIETHLVERADGTVYSTRQIGKGQIAITQYELIESFGRQSLLRVTIHTGRKHQIRVHLRERGWSVVGDRMYGNKNEPGRLMLAATKLVIHHPQTGVEMTFEIPLPTEFRKLVQAGAEKQAGKEAAGA